MDSEDGDHFIKASLLFRACNGNPPFSRDVEFGLTSVTATGRLCAHSRKGPRQRLTIPTTRDSPSIVPEHECGHDPSIPDFARAPLYILLLDKLVGSGLFIGCPEFHLAQCQVCKVGSDPSPSLFPSLPLRGTWDQRWTHESALGKSPRQLLIHQLCLVPWEFAESP